MHSEKDKDERIIRASARSFTPLMPEILVGSLDNSYSTAKANHLNRALFALS